MQTWALPLPIDGYFLRVPLQCWNVVDRGNRSGETVIMGMIPAVVSMTVSAHRHTLQPSYDVDSTL